MAGAFRSIPFEILSFNELGVLPIANELIKKPKGLVLVTGPTGTGKSTTLAAMIDKINQEKSCHIITVVVTQDRTREHWLGTLHKPSHIEIKLTEAQREALVSYLVINAAIPIDEVPEDLRAGGATY